MNLPDEIITHVMHFARGINSHEKDAYIKDIKKIRHVVNYGVKHALMQVKMSEYFTLHSAAWYWGDTYQLHVNN